MFVSKFKVEMSSISGIDLCFFGPHPNFGKNEINFCCRPFCFWSFKTLAIGIGYGPFLHTITEINTAQNRIY